MEALEKSSHALCVHLNTVLKAIAHDGELHSAHLTLEKDPEMKELINILSSVQVKMSYFLIALGVLLIVLKFIANERHIQTDIDKKSR